jgi:L-threonylcarbamoyladenylate synthase
MQAFWPGALTIVFKAAAAVSPLLTAGTDKIGVRISSHPAARAIAANLGHPITATSANLSGAPECSTADEVAKQIGDKLDAIVDSGKTAGGLGSTIIDVTLNPAKILRQGVIASDTIKKYVDIK